MYVEGVANGSKNYESPRERFRGCFMELRRYFLSDCRSQLLRN